MMPALALQKAIRARLTADAAVTDLVEPEHVFDRHGLPEAFPCIILGEAVETRADEVAGRYFVITATLHVWAREPNTVGVKDITGTVRRALRDRSWPADDAFVHALTFEGARYLRDPHDPALAHGVVTVRALVEELS